MRRLSVCTVLILLIFSACDYPIFVHYTVSNAAEDTLMMKYSYKTSYSIKKGKDTFLVLLPNQSDTLFTYRSISSSVYHPEESDTLKFLYNLEVTGNLSDYSSDMKLKKNWKFIKTKRNVAHLEFQFH